jgi:GH24 family phage-related lysozyme (muramidase)
LKVFKDSTLPRFVKMTLTAYPGAEKLHPDVLGALVSVVFNRGASTTGSRRKEMAMLKEAVRHGDIEMIETLIRQMKRLWAGTKFHGLVRRRDAEADLVKLHV